ncbi:acyl carrier protein [Candidatus Ruminimicrobiellum ovillum]|uniref:acyl carrier protein n=1 Tax=Candidatus Ruminimicrobiellum ovillum TaxID=1947927 RepID=UPI00355A3FC8
MEKEQIIKELEQIFKSVLEEDDLTISENMETSDIQGWDSLAHINIIEEIEKHFNIHISVGEIVVLKTVGDMVKLIQSKI